MNEWTVDVDRRIYKGLAVAMEHDFVRPGDNIVIVTGWKPGSGSTNTMRIIKAVDMKEKDLLEPITGISSVPSFGTLDNNESVKSLSPATSLEDDVKFF